MAKYRKKPIVIDAWRYETDAPIPVWVMRAAHKLDTGKDELTIATLEGHMKATPGDWIIKGVAGEVYPCRDDIFQQTYEPA